MATPKRLQTATVGATFVTYDEVGLAQKLYTELAKPSHRYNAATWTKVFEDTETGKAIIEADITYTAKGANRADVDQWLDRFLDHAAIVVDPAAKSVEKLEA